jgi:hypothetical protein
MSTYNNQLWAKMVTDWVMSASRSPGNAAGETAPAPGAAAPRNDRQLNASSQLQAAAA